MNLYIKFIYIKIYLMIQITRLSIRANNYHEFEVMMNANEVLKSLSKLKCDLKYL